MNTVILVWLGVALIGPICVVMDLVRDLVALVRRQAPTVVLSWARPYGIAMAGTTTGVMFYAIVTVLCGMLR